MTTHQATLAKEVVRLRRQVDTLEAKAELAEQRESDSAAFLEYVCDWIEARHGKKTLQTVAKHWSKGE